MKQLIYKMEVDDNAVGDGWIYADCRETLVYVRQSFGLESDECPIWKQDTTETWWKLIEETEIMPVPPVPLPLKP